MQQKNLYLYCNIALLMAALISGLSFFVQKLLHKDTEYE